MSFHEYMSTCAPSFVISTSALLHLKYVVSKRNVWLINCTFSELGFHKIQALVLVMRC